MARVLTPAFTEKVYMAAVKAWGREFRDAEDKSQVKGFDKFLNEYSKKAGFEDWNDFAISAARAMGAQAWSECVMRFSKNQQEFMMELQRELMEKAKKEAEQPEEKKD